MKIVLLIATCLVAIKDVRGDQNIMWKCKALNYEHEEECVRDFLVESALSIKPGVNCEFDQLRKELLTLAETFNTLMQVDYTMPLSSYYALYSQSWSSSYSSLSRYFSWSSSSSSHDWSSSYSWSQSDFSWDSS